MQEEQKETSKKSKKVLKRVQLVSSGEKWNFEENPTFTGYPTDRENIVYEEDGKTVKINEKGQEMNLGRYFVTEDGEEFCIPHLSSIDKALNMIVEDENGEEKSILELKPLMEITLIEKTTHKGKPWYRFNIDFFMEE